MSLNIPSQIILYRNNAYDIKKKLFSFLEKYILTTSSLSINDFITDSFLLLEQEDTDKNNGKYTYWVDGGLSWYYWYFQNLKNTNDEELISMMICNLKFHYIFNNINKWYNKLETLYNFVISLQETLASNGIYTDIITNNISYDPSATLSKFEILYDLKNTKEPSCNIKLVLNTSKTHSGGAKFKRLNKNILLRKKIIHAKKFEKIRELADKKVENFKDAISDFNISDLHLLNNKIIVEFQMEYFHPFDSDGNQINDFDIIKFEKFYINKYKSFTNSYSSVINPLVARNYLNKLNINGLITYSYLYSSKTEVESGINVEKIRQDLLFKNILNEPQLVQEIFTQIIDKYNELFENFNSYNSFFIEKLEEVMLEHSIPNYSKLIDNVDKYLMSLFRPSINSFIKNVNQELFNYHNVKLFIAGGDAMRRFNYDIAFTSDIDTKLHIQNATGGRNLHDIKISIISIILKHIVKLRNYLEENKLLVLNELITPENDGIEVFKYELDNNIEIKINLLLEPDIRDKYQQFRTREIKKNEAMPIDLYSLDFRYSISIYKRNVKLNTYYHQLSLLDVVIIDNKDFHQEDMIEVNGLAYASKPFLIKDFEITYNTESMALGRISNGKSDKDIIRYNLLNIDEEPNSSYLTKINDIKESIQHSSFDSLNPNLLSIINKIKNNNRFTISDFIYLNSLSNSDFRIIKDFPLLTNFLKNIKDIKINLPFEDLNIITSNYDNYTPSTDNDIIKYYLNVFSNITNINDGLFKHIMSYNNDSILYYYNKFNPSFENKKTKISALAVKKTPFKTKK